MERRTFLKLSAVAWGPLPPFSRYYATRVIDHSKILYTFDDDPFDINRTRKLVKVLKENKCETQLYLTGSGIKKFPKSVDYFLSNGYDIGWHSMYHDIMTRKDDKDFLADINNWKKTLKAVAPSFAPTLARFPYGKGRRRQIRILKEEGLNVQACATKSLSTSNWDVDSHDWDPYKVLSSEEMYQEILGVQNRHKNPVVVLFHFSLTIPLAYSSKTRRRNRKGDVIMQESAITGQLHLFKKTIDMLRGNGFPFLPFGE